jgi:Fur family transcriptional regulator, ferric uptake regulator
MRMILILAFGSVTEMASAAQRRRWASRLLGALGLRATHQRVLVLAELMRERDDVTAQQLHERLRRRGSRLGLATVYRTLALLTEEGAIDAISHRQGELCYRWCGDEHHHHLTCSDCHRVVELVDCELEPWLERVSADHDFVTTGHRLEVAGLCGDCRAA